MGHAGPHRRGGGINVYGYCVQGPVRNADPSGLTSLASAPGALTAGEAPEIVAGALRSKSAIDSLLGIFSNPFARIAAALGFGLGALASDGVKAVPGRRKSAPRRRVVIGQNMQRVQAAADAYGAETYGGYPMYGKDPAGGWPDNQAWLTDKVARKYDTIDIGWDEVWERGGSYSLEDALLNALGNPRRIRVPWPSSGEGGNTWSPPPGSSVHCYR